METGRWVDPSEEFNMEYENYARSPPPRGGVGGREARDSRDGRDRDDYRSSDPYRDRRRSPGQRTRSPFRLPVRRRPYLPPPDRRRDRERRRSRSPTNIDRYAPSDRLPRDDYYGSRNRDDRDTHRERRRSSPQPTTIDRYVPGMAEPTPPQLLVNPLPDPMKLEFQVGFTWFAEWWRAEQRIKEEKERQKSGRAPPRVRGERETREDREAERPKIQAAYDAYKEKLQKTQAQTFVRAHKDEDWFRERYAPETRDAFRSKLVAYRHGLFDLWRNDLEGGVFDEFTLEGLYKSDAVANGMAAEREEGETTGANEVLGVGDLMPSKGGELRDPTAALPTLLVKTIAPTVSREKMMAFAKEHLNGGEDGEVEGGFKWLSLSDPNPLKRCHRMGWIILNPETSQETTEDLIDEPADRDEAKEEGEEGEAMATEKARPKTTTEKGLEKINGKTIEDPDRGNFTVHCGVHRPPEAPRKKALWDLFSAPERIARDLDLATRLVRKLDNELGEEYFGVAMIEKRVQDLADRGLLSPPEKTQEMKDFNMDVEDGEEEEGALPDEDDEVDDEEALIMKKKLDLLVEYLRRVYNFCFFCVFESDSVHELQRKCPGGHLRRPRSSLTTAAKEVARASAEGQPFPLPTSGSKNESAVAEEGDMAIDPESPTDERKSSGLMGGVRMSGKSVNQLQRAYKWVKTFEEKILQIVEPENVDLQKLGGVDASKGVEEDLQKVSLPTYSLMNRTNIFDPVRKTRRRQQIPLQSPHATRLLSNRQHPRARQTPHHPHHRQPPGAKLHQTLQRRGLLAQTRRKAAPGIPPTPPRRNQPGEPLRARSSPHRPQPQRRQQQRPLPDRRQRAHRHPPRLPAPLARPHGLPHVADDGHGDAPRVESGYGPYARYAWRRSRTEPRAQ